MDARRRRAVQDWLKYRAGLERSGGGHGDEVSPPLSMDEIRQRAVAAWQGLQARGAKSQPTAGSGRERGSGRDREETRPARDTPGLDDDFSG
jgi:hypothetical protein